MLWWHVLWVILVVNVLTSIPLWVWGARPHQHQMLCNYNTPHTAWQLSKMVQLQKTVTIRITLDLNPKKSKLGNLCTHIRQHKNLNYRPTKKYLVANTNFVEEET